MQPHIILADDHSMIRKGMKLLLMTQLGCKNINEAGSCNELLSELKNKQCTHLFLDVIFSDGTALEIAPAIKKLYPDIKILIFTMQVHEVYAEAFKQYGIYYYLNKSSNEEDTISYIRKFLNDDAGTTQNMHSPFHSNPFSSLAPRELEILHYLLNGHKTNNISKNLNLSDSTVSTVKKRIFEKTETYNITQLLELALLYNISF